MSNVAQTDDARTKCTCGADVFEAIDPGPPRRRVKVQAVARGRGRVTLQHDLAGGAPTLCRTGGRTNFAIHRCPPPRAFSADAFERKRRP